MKKLEYMLECIRTERYRERAWLLSVLGILPKEQHSDSLRLAGLDILKTNDIKHPYKLMASIGSNNISKPTATLEISNLNNDNVVEIEDYIVDKPLFGRNEKIELKAGQLHSLRSNITTTYGLLLVNLILIEYPYKGLVEYLNEEFTPSKINKIAYNALMSNKCSIDMHLRFENGISALTALSQTVVPSASLKAITPNPEIAKVKPKLLEEYKDRMNDPAAVAELQAILVQMDKDYLAGDPAERFFIKKKSEMARLRTKGMFGAEQDFTNESKISVMTNSLEEGWEIKDLPMLNNTIRGGSFFRGAQTALAGYETKVIARIYQNYNFVDKDCGTKHGAIVNINSLNYKNFIGRYLLGKEDPLEVNDLEKLIGKTIIIRSPMYCVLEETNYCYKCIGDNIAKSGIGVTALMTAISSTFLSLFLAVMHTAGVTTHKYNYLDRIT